LFKLKNFLILFILSFFFSFFAEAYVSDRLLCQNINVKGEIFCKKLIKESYLILDKYSGLENTKKLNRELKKCEKFKISFPIFCKIITENFNIFLLIFLINFLILFIFTNFIKKKL
tara:strand:- start:2935 stop:3282 length:348 start_codon:yes stop_codon:yes gene_type:complete